MKTYDATRIRLGILKAHKEVEALAKYDDFTRGFSYTANGPQKDKLQARAYRRTWRRLEAERAGIPVSLARHLWVKL